MTDPQVQRANEIVLITRAFVIFVGTAVGGAIGSFLGLLLDRMPRGESIVFPASRCSACGRSLKIWENIPIAAWLLFKGKCQTCGAWIGWTTFLIETGLGIVGGTLLWWLTR